MSLKLYPPFLSGLDHNQHLRDFFKTTLENFKLEIEESILSFPFYADQKHGIFSLYTEMSCLGLWDRAIAKGYPDAQSLRELAVYEKSKFKGRPDLLLSLPNMAPRIPSHGKARRSHILFEGKFYEWKGGNRYNDQHLKIFFDKLRNQAEGYRNSLKRDYSPIIVPIVFEWIRTNHKNTNDRIKKAEKFLSTLRSDSATQFCALYTLSDSGVLIYGKVFDEH